MCRHTRFRRVRRRCPAWRHLHCASLTPVFAFSGLTPVNIGRQYRAAMAPSGRVCDRCARCGQRKPRSYADPAPGRRFQSRRLRCGGLACVAAGGMSRSGRERGRCGAAARTARRCKTRERPGSKIAVLRTIQRPDAVSRLYGFFAPPVSKPFPNGHIAQRTSSCRSATSGPPDRFYSKGNGASPGKATGCPGPRNWRSTGPGYRAAAGPGAPAGGSIPCSCPRRPARRHRVRSRPSDR